MSPPALPFVTAFYAALIGFLCVILSLLVIGQRVRKGISIGDGGDTVLARLTRVFGNFAEYAALALLLFALVEICGGSRWLVHALGITFVIGRLAHAYGLAGTLGANAGRTIGMVLTIMSLIVASLTLLGLVTRKVFA